MSKAPYFCECWAEVGLVHWYFQSTSFEKRWSGKQSMLRELCSDIQMETTHSLFHYSRSGPQYPLQLEAVKVLKDAAHSLESVSSW